MKRKLAVPLLAAVLLLAACGGRSPEGQDAVWSADGYTLAAPQDLADQLVVNPGDMDPTPGTLFAIYHREAYEAGDGDGWLLSIMRWDQATLTDFLSGSDGALIMDLAEDGEGYLYYMWLAADSQIAGTANYADMRELLDGEPLREMLADFVSRNSLTPPVEAD